MATMSLRMKSRLRRALHDAKASDDLHDGSERAHFTLGVLILWLPR
jgi:hypothetical protein